MKKMLITCVMAAVLAELVGFDLVAAVQLELYWDTGDIGIVQDIEVADVDMDGMKETIVALELGYGVTSPVVIYDGVSQAVEHTIWLPLGNPNQVEVADVDGDGITELIVGSTTTWEQGAQGYIYIYDGTTYDLEWESENIGTVASLHVEDFDLDGVKEIFAGIAYAPVQQDFWRILILDGTTHAIEFDYTLATHFFFQQRSTVCNLDDDPALEIIFAAVDYSVSNSSEIFVMDGLTHAIEQQWSGSFRCYGITSGDVDNDGQREIIVALTTGNTAADIKTVKVFNTSWAEECSYVFPPHVGWGPAALALGDVNGDIIPEIVVGSHLGTGVGSFSILDGQTCSLIWSDDAGGSVEVLVFGDVNNNGRAELCVGDRAGWSSGHMTVYEIVADSQGLCFDSAVAYTAGNQPQSVVAADFDGVRGIDLAVANRLSHNVTVLMNNGNGTFGPSMNYPAGTYPQFVCAADLDGLNGVDLVVGHSSCCNISVLMNNGDGTFASPVNYATGNQSNSVAAVDIDGDNDVDLAVANAYSDNVSLLLNNGDGTFSAATNYPVGDLPASIHAADLDGDGDFDLSVLNVGSQDISILENIGGTFTALANYPTGSECRLIEGADVDGDHDIDLAVTSWSANDVLVFMNNGNGTFAPAVSYAAGNSPHDIYAADLDGVNGVDLAVANLNGNYISILANNGDGTFAPPVNYPAGFNPYSITAADLDGVNGDDLAVANLSSADVSVLLNCSLPDINVQTHLDIKPGSCPNPLNVKRHRMDSWEQEETSNDVLFKGSGPGKHKAVLPAAILGTEEFDVADINVSTVMLEGVEPLRYNYEDVATPVDDTTECACTTLGPDGFDDLTLKFDRAAIIAALGEVHDGDVIPLTITGELYDGTAVEGTDCVVIIGGCEPADGAPQSEGQPEVHLIGNYPNPFNPVTEISFSLTSASDVKLEIYNVMGQKVATVVDRFMEAGEHTVRWDASSFSSGVYFYKLEAGEFVETRKMVLLK